LTVQNSSAGQLILDWLVSDFKADFCSVEFYSAEDEIKVKAQYSSDTR